MSLEPDHSSLFGGGWLTVTFESLLDTGGDYYIVFAGRDERHVTKATVTGDSTVRAIIPDHHTAESLPVTVLSRSPSHALTPLTSPSLTLTYTDSPAHAATRHLVASVDNPLALEPRGEGVWPGLDLAGVDLKGMDGELLQVFLETKLPTDWNLLGEDYNLPEIPPRESLLHFSARLGLRQLTEFFMYQPGSLDAVGLPNHQGHVPLDLAREAGDTDIVDTLLGKNSYATGGPPWLEKWKKPKPSTMVQRHDHGLATITNYVNQSRRTVEDDIQLLHNMSRVVYDDASLQMLETPSDIRQRHSVAEDVLRNKLYYADANSRHQRHSLAEQRTNLNTRLFDIDFQSQANQPMYPDSGGRKDTSDQQSVRPGLISPSPKYTRSRSSINKPRLPSPERRDPHSDHRTDPSHPPQGGPYPPPPRPPSRTQPPSPPHTVSHARQSSYEKSRERRPISSSDTVSLEKQLLNDSGASNHSNQSGDNKAGVSGYRPTRRRRPPPPSPPQTQPQDGTGQSERSRHYSGHDIGRPQTYIHAESAKRQDSWESAPASSANQLQAESGDSSEKRKSSWHPSTTTLFHSSNHKASETTASSPPDPYTQHNAPYTQHNTHSSDSYANRTTYTSENKENNVTMPYNRPTMHHQSPPGSTNQTQSPPANQNGGPSADKWTNENPVPYHPRSSSMDGYTGGVISAVDYFSSPQTNSLGRSNKLGGGGGGGPGFSLPPQGGLSVVGVRPLRPLSAGHAGQRTIHSPPQDYRSVQYSHPADTHTSQSPAQDGSQSHLTGQGQGEESPRQAESSKSEYSSCSDDPNSHDASGRHRYTKRSKSNTPSHHHRIYSKRPANQDLDADAEAGDYVSVYQSPDGSSGPVVLGKSSNIRPVNFVNFVLYIVSYGFQFYASLWLTCSYPHT